jgi:hypothetical protein
MGSMIFIDRFISPPDLFDLLNSFGWCRSRRIPRELTMRVRRFFEGYYERKVFMDEEGILDKLTQNLKQVRGGKGSSADCFVGTRGGSGPPIGCFEVLGGGFGPPRSCSGVPGGGLDPLGGPPQNSPPGPPRGCCEVLRGGSGPLRGCFDVPGGEYLGVTCPAPPPRRNPRHSKAKNKIKSCTLPRVFGPKGGAIVVLRLPTPRRGWLGNHDG